ncbi:NTP transferase domain-containing protein [Clostridium sp. P21]|uniref:NTP transferase domain-containing protein n=1 Tax=Clostridium muellerianum TaxID=2716538 RepID=A0A7Y0EGC0_9CLOT|nr:sugar phosphate nucleotidyltransferase [Clostridium muellerianum]NMM62923.1 NTP transferase domain-containing protein [Clostridium muellerianum]
MKAIIMAGGEGTRLRPLTCNIPKPMMPIMDKPVMQYAIELLKENGINDIGVTLQYLPDEIINYFGDGKEFGVNIRYFIEEMPLGTAGSVKNAEGFLDDTFIVISGDALTDIDLSKAIAYHKKKQSISTLVLKEVAVPLEFGVVVTDNDGKVTGFLEKPSWSEVFSDKVNTGIYILEPEIFSYFEKNQKFDFSNDLFPILLSEKRPMFGYVAEGYWCDIGNIEQYIRCHFDILKGLVKVDIKGEKYKDGIWIGQNCQISKNALVSAPAYIGSGSKIYDSSEIGPYTILGKNNIVSKDATIKRSVTFDNCYIGSKSQVRGAVLCKKVQMEPRASVFEGAAIGDDTLIRERAIVKPNIKIWPNKVIEASTVVKSNVIWGGKFSKSLFGKRGITGEVNVDITPEFVSKLGAAYGSLLKADSKVAIACTNNGAAQMFKYSLATGLLSMGIEVLDLHRMPRPAVRQATLFFGVQGSIHVYIDNENSEKVNIVFMDENGLDIDKGIERKIENSFIREDFRRVRTDCFKQINHMDNSIEYYIRHLVNELGVRSIRKQKYKVVLSIKNPMVLNIVQNIFQELKINVKLYNEFNNILGLKKEVIESSSNLGISIDDGCEKAIFIDEKGNIIRDEAYDAINALVMLKTTNLSTLVAPVTASSTMQEIADMCGCKFVRTKTSQKFILDAYLKNESRITRREVVDSYLMTLDAICVAVLTINFMAGSNLPLSTIVSQIPRYYTAKEEVKCPWNLKGKVMRNLIEENHSKSVDLIEGVKLNFNDGWALVLPDADEPLCRVYAESKDSDELKKLTDELLKRIEAITLE